MKIGWVIPTVGCFGAVREMVEVSNQLVGLGHHVIIYSPTGGRCKWMPCRTGYGDFNQAVRDRMDVVIGITDWKPELDNIVFAAKTRLRAICLLGFSPDKELADYLRGVGETNNKGFQQIRKNLNKEIVILTDSQWQIDWIKEITGKTIGPSFGGVNTDMFRPTVKPAGKSIRVISSGDKRPRKGFDTVEKAVEIASRINTDIQFDVYWDKSLFTQDLAAFYSDADIFVDGHKRGGWCNPVAEAMACGTSVVCTNIGATQSFAINERTAITVEPDDAIGMANAIVRLADSKELRNRLAKNALRQIQKFSYYEVSKNLELYLMQQLMQKRQRT